MPVSEFPLASLKLVRRTPPFSHLPSRKPAVAQSSSRWAAAASASLCVTTMIVKPSARSCWNSAMIVAPIALSRLPVGSSARRILRLVDQGARDGDALHLAPGELVRAMVAPVGEPDLVQQFADPLLGPAPGKERGQGDILGDGQGRQQPEVLEDEADFLAAQPRPRALGQADACPAPPRAVCPRSGHPCSR